MGWQMTCLLYVTSETLLTLLLILYHYFREYKREYIVFKSCWILIVYSSNTSVENKLHYYPFIMSKERKYDDNYLKYGFTTIEDTMCYLSYGFEC